MNREQLLRLRKRWVWVGGQLASGYLIVNGNDAGRFRYRVSSVIQGVPYAVWKGQEYEINLPDPQLTDKATADGAPRTARAAWGDPEACVYPPSCRRSGSGRWTVYVSTDDGGELAFGGATETEAWLAAIDAAPEDGGAQ